MMPSTEVRQIIKLIQEAECAVWLDGGWGVDALLEKQTRPHQDLDVAIKLAEVDTIKRLLENRGYEVFEDEMPTRLELRDAQDYRIDLHPLTFDERGNGLQRLQDGSFGIYTVRGLAGTGKIGGVKVKCLSPELQVRFHEGYTPDENDRHDVALLVERYHLVPPIGY